MGELKKGNGGKHDQNHYIHVCIEVSKSHLHGALYVVQKAGLPRLDETLGPSQHHRHKARWHRPVISTRESRETKGSEVQGQPHTQQVLGQARTQQASSRFPFSS